MTNTTTRRPELLRAARLGAFHGQLAWACREGQSNSRACLDFMDEHHFNRLSAGLDAWVVFQAAWLTARERAQCAWGLIPAHLTAPAARARA